MSLRRHRVAILHFFAPGLLQPVLRQSRHRSRGPRSNKSRLEIPRTWPHRVAALAQPCSARHRWTYLGGTPHRPGYRGHSKHNQPLGLPSAHRATSRTCTSCSWISGCRAGCGTPPFGIQTRQETASPGIRRSRELAALRQRLSSVSLEVVSAATGVPGIEEARYHPSVLDDLPV